MGSVAVACGCGCGRLPRKGTFLRGHASRLREWPTPDHGSVARYRRGCRCESCRAANAWKKRDARARELRVDLEQALNRQDGVCAICGGDFDGSPNMDHDHRTGEFRGLLCSRCNLGIGCLGDNPEVLIRAADYVAPGGRPGHPDVRRTT